MSRIDVVVPCYNYGSFLNQCVDSLLNQAGVDLRVLIIDDASLDNTAEVAADFAGRDSRVTVVRHSANRGHIATYNEGIEWASAEYMLILSADDYLLPGALSRAAQLMDTHSEVGFTAGNVVVLGDDGTETPVRRFVEVTGQSDQCILGGLEFIELSGAHNLVATCTAVVRTELQKHLGGYRPELPHAGDMEMWLRFAAHAPVGFIAAFQGVYRQHRANMSSPYNTMRGFLAELQQRKAAFDCLFETCRDTLPDAGRLRWKLFGYLGAIAVKAANDAFNMNELEASRQLAAFALGVSPQITRSSAWMKLTFKQGIGRRAWSALRPAVAAIRGVQPNQR